MNDQKILLFHVDAFTSKPFSGNPAAVCLLMETRDAAWMQSMAAEINLSETAFVTRLAQGFGLRWFTPTVEVDLCGHATLAAAHVLWARGWSQVGQHITFHTRSGLLVAQQQGAKIELDFPLAPAEPVEAPEGLWQALGVSSGKVFFNQADYLILLEDEAAVVRLQPDFRAMGEINARGVIVTAPSGSSKYDFVSRFFAPACGIDEDPVTGSAHCTLAPFWFERLGKTEMLGYQASSRGGEVTVKLRRDRVLLSGEAVTVFRGEGYV